MSHKRKTMTQRRDEMFDALERMRHALTNFADLRVAEAKDGKSRHASIETAAMAALDAQRDAISAFNNAVTAARRGK